MSRVSQSGIKEDDLASLARREGTVSPHHDPQNGAPGACPLKCIYYVVSSSRIVHSMTLDVPIQNKSGAYSLLRGVLFFTADLN